MFPTLSQPKPGELAKMSNLITEIGVALLTTLDQDGGFHTRPVQTLEIESDRTIWFFTNRSSPKVEELKHEARVNLGYADPAKNIYVAVTGIASLVHDPERAKRLWSAEQRAYFPQGPEDERLVLLRVDIERAEYWIAPGWVSYMVAAVTATVSGTPAGTVGENRLIE
jgi:general stress protein 26